ncbi:MAG: hypothetical protein PVI30_27160 [Myxococcales bacterium]|jgi:hypothetical protein
MRLLYISDDFTPGSGVAIKVLAKTRIWEQLGHDVWLISARTPVPRRIAEVERIVGAREDRRSLPRRVLGELSVRRGAAAALWAAAARVGADAIYSRELPPGLLLRGPFFRSRPLVLEVNSDSVLEMDAGSLRRWRSARARAAQLRDARGVVFVSHELKVRLGAGVAHSVVLANGCASHPALPRRRPARPTLVLVGSARQPWTGFDRFAELARRLPELDFVTVGQDPSRLPDLPNLESHPRVGQAEVDRILAGCTVGMGPLALDRKQMREASPLKTRNYLAMGLPVIQSYQDTDLDEDSGCVLQLPPAFPFSEHDLERLREFARRARHDDRMSERALSLARGPLSVEAKERQRLSFIESLVRTSR